MKIYVYAICKNESKFVNRFMDSVADADGVYVLDTGSTDGSAEMLRERGAVVKTEIISPFRFDSARNKSLALVPDDADFYVCLDLDEVLESGWRAGLEKTAASAPEANRLLYRYVWSHNADGSDGVVFWAEKIHRKGYEWRGAVHETVVPKAGTADKSAYAYGVQVSHYPDDRKSRSSYLPLLEIAASESPADDRTSHYLGREYMFAGMYDKAVTELKRHLALPSAVWADERAASMRYISKCYARLGNSKESVSWALRAVAESPDTREPYLQLARAFFDCGNYAGVLYAASAGLGITERKLSYITEPDAWGAPLHDLLSIAYYQFGQYKKAEIQARLALSFGDDARIKNNLRLYIEAQNL